MSRFKKNIPNVRTAEKKVKFDASPPRQVKVHMPTQMKSGSIFYCDDDSDDLIVFADAIQDFAPQIKCITMHEPEKALAYLLKTSDIPDMIFLDINMPKMTGVELLSALRGVERFKGVPVIMYTTSKNKKEIERCLALGAMEVVQKLYSYETIEANLCKVIDRYWPEFSMVHKA